MFQILCEPDKSEDRYKQSCLVGCPVGPPESDAIPAWQIENLAANSRTFSRILLPATRSSLTSPQTAGLLEHFGFDASLPRVDALHSLHRSNLALVWLPGKPAMKASQSRPLQYSDESYSSFGIGRPANLPESTDCAEKLKYRPY